MSTMREKLVELEGEVQRRKGQLQEARRHGDWTRILGAQKNYDEAVDNANWCRDLVARQERMRGGGA